MGKRLSTYDFDKSLGGVSLAVAMNFFIQPLLERTELPLGKGRIQISQVTSCGFEELSRIHIPQGIRREIP